MSAQTIDGVKVDNYKISRSGDDLVVTTQLDLAELSVPNNRAVLITPILTDGNHVQTLSSVGLYGRRRYIVYDRNNALGLTGEGETVYKASEAPQVINYKDVIPFESWMDGADLILKRRDYGCCQNLLAEQNQPLGSFGIPTFTPAFAYAQPEVETRKARSLEGSAFVDFVVDKTDIRPSYRNNTVELGKIRATIDSVRNDSDIKITSLSIKGFASPEGRYSHNADLAKGRTAALKEYVRNLYSFSDDFIKTSYEPEDWEGLRKAVVDMNIENKDGILEIIDSNLEPDAKDAKIKSKYPTQYSYLLKNVYPALRHSDYKVEYEIRGFQDVKEIAEIYKTQPQKLSLNELYMLAGQYDPGSEEYNDIFETAVKLYSGDETANLNAANAALQRGDYVYAEKYLKKAGNSAAAEYTRGTYQALKGNYDDALTYFKSAQSKGESRAADAISQIENIKKFL